VNRLCQEEAVERSLILPSLLTDAEITTLCGVSGTPERSIIRKRQERNEESLVHTPGGKDTQEI
jgi:hypothetical protein